MKDKKNTGYRELTKQEIDLMHQNKQKGFLILILWSSFLVAFLVSLSVGFL